MSKINLPGFTAEASLYGRGGHYYVADGALPMAGLGQQAVFLSQATGGWTGEQKISQGWWQCWYWGSCIICCSPWWCWYLCYGTASHSVVSHRVR
jgi:hypothetical protein